MALFSLVLVAIPLDRTSLIQLKALAKQFSLSSKENLYTLFHLGEVLTARLDDLTDVLQILTAFSLAIRRSHLFNVQGFPLLHGLCSL